MKKPHEKNEAEGARVFGRMHSFVSRAGADFECGPGSHLLYLMKTGPATTTGTPPASIPCSRPRGRPKAPTHRLSACGRESTSAVREKERAAG